MAPRRAVVRLTSVDDWTVGLPWVGPPQKNRSARGRERFLVVWLGMDGQQAQPRQVIGLAIGREGEAGESGVKDRREGEGGASGR